MLALALAVVPLAPNPLPAQAFCSFSLPIFWSPLDGENAQPNNCFGSDGFRCYKAENLGLFARTVDEACDPNVQSCAARFGVDFLFPGLKAMIAEDGLTGSPTPRVEWYRGDGTLLAVCGEASLGGQINADFIETYLEFGDVTCDNTTFPTQVFEARAVVCSSASGCRQVTSVEVPDGGPDASLSLGCPPAPLMATCEDSACGACVQGVPLDGDGPQMANQSRDTGPGARLRYAAGGPGRSGSPGETAWRDTLGRYWSHDYAERIFDQGDASQVWLVTRSGSFRRFAARDGSGVYTDVRPRDEYRTLTDTGSGWELEDLEGTVQAFDIDGRWTSTTDRFGNATTGSYDGSGRLAQVLFPDGRSETLPTTSPASWSRSPRWGWTGPPPAPGTTPGWVTTWSASTGRMARRSSLPTRTPATPAT